VETERIGKILRLRPGCRDTALRYLTQGTRVSVRQLQTLAVSLRSGYVVDQSFYVSVANSLVESVVSAHKSAKTAIMDIVQALPGNDYCGVYGQLVLLSKFGSPEEIINTIEALT
jgi:hypothetical protein